VVAGRAASFDDYLASLPPRERAALTRLRRAVRRAAPRASECLLYGMPAFRWNGRALVAMRAAAQHCALHPMDGRTVRELAGDLAAYDTSPGTIRFDASKPLPAALVAKIVRVRIARLGATKPRAGKRKRPRAKVEPKKKARARRPPARRTS
jgi:uncharacterized protein YdhG (YjbR/CyaY superfamily)